MKSNVPGHLKIEIWEIYGVCLLQDTGKRRFLDDTTLILDTTNLPHSIEIFNCPSHGSDQRSLMANVLHGVNKSRLVSYT